MLRQRAQQRRAAAKRRDIGGFVLCLVAAVALFGVSFAGAARYLDTVVGRSCLNFGIGQSTEVFCRK